MVSLSFEPIPSDSVTTAEAAKSDTVRSAISLVYAIVEAVPQLVASWSAR